MTEMAPAAMEALSLRIRRLRSLLEQEEPLDADTRARSDAAAHTVLALVFLRQLEACNVVERHTLTGGWQSPGYLEFRASEPDVPLDEHRSYSAALQRAFDDLGVQLPGLYAAVPLGRTFTPSGDNLRELVDALNAPDLDAAWLDDTTLGWVYQFWNDPQREAIDARVGPRGKVSVQEIASKTQLFTEHYMAEWLLANSVGRLAAVSRASELEILDPACGCGHLLAAAFDLLVQLYRQEAREFSDAEIAARILGHNLYGVDIDARAVQVSAAVLYLKAKRLAPHALIPPMNLVAATFDVDGHPGVRGSLIRFGAGRATTLFDDDERLFTRHCCTDDLGVRFDGTPAGAGRRLRSILTDGQYDVVVFNPPYLATSKIDMPASELAKAFNGAPDIFAAFVDRAFELCKPSGLIAFVALSNWMFLSTYRGVRERMLRGHIVAIVDLGKGAFRRASKLIQTAMVVASPTPAPGAISLAGRVGSRDAIPASQVTALAAALGEPDLLRPFEPAVFAAIDGAPLLFWVEAEFIRRYASLKKIGELADGAGGIATTNNDRFLRAIWELALEDARAAVDGRPGARHVPYLKGAEGREWIEPCRWLLRTADDARELRQLVPSVRVARPDSLGVAYTTIGQRFGARLHSVASVRDVSGASFFPNDRVTAAELVCALNRTAVRELASAFNPTINFQLGDVRRLPFDPVDCAGEIVGVLRHAFVESECGSELALDYDCPASDPWEEAQAWAQRAVDRPKGEPLPRTGFTGSGISAWRHVSHAVGVALGRFGPNGGLATSLEHALPHGILFLGRATSSLGDPACAGLVAAWGRHGVDIDPGAELDHYLRLTFFQSHRELYENRPIYLPLASSKKTFVALVSIHRFTGDTLSTLLTGHLMKESAQLRAEPASGGQKVLDELNDFMAKVLDLAEHGPPPADDKTKPREADARFTMDLEDGVMVNSAALWSLLEPSWKEPKSWWKQLANADGKKDFDWSRVAARYFPERVRRKCREDPSLAVAHGIVGSASSPRR